MVESNAFVCTSRNQSHPLDTPDRQCACGGLFDLGDWPASAADVVETSQQGPWRYRQLPPLESRRKPVRLGEGRAPWVWAHWDSIPLLFELESPALAASFRDWGLAVRAAEGSIAAVGEGEILAARNQLVQCGFYVEEAVAAPVQALPGSQPSLGAPLEDPIVVPLTGHGLNPAPVQRLDRQRGT
jgi:threonine synthase